MIFCIMEVTPVIKQVIHLITHVSLDTLTNVNWKKHYANP